MIHPINDHESEDEETTSDTIQEPLTHLLKTKPETHSSHYSEVKDLVAETPKLPTPTVNKAITKSSIRRSSFSTKPKVNARAAEDINNFLRFTHAEDDLLYKIHCKALFNIATFWPIVAAFMMFNAVHAFESLSNYPVFMMLNFIFTLIFIFSVIIFTITQAVNTDFFERLDILPASIARLSQLILDSHIEDCIIILMSLALGCLILAIGLGNLCRECGNPDKLYTLDCDSDDMDSDSNAPKEVVFFAYIFLVLTPSYFKTINRFVILFSWLVLTIFIVIGHIVTSWHMQLFMVIMPLFALATIYEYESSKMLSFAVSKHQSSTAQSTVSMLEEQNKEYEWKLTLALVNQMLPPKVSEAIKNGKKVIPEEFEDVTIFFSDVEGFTTICSQCTPIQVVRMLNELYMVMDYCTSLFPLYKVETIGDAYMVVGGLPERSSKHAKYVADFAILVNEACKAVKSPIDGSSIRIRIGVHSGPVMAGVVGSLMPRYCLFGDTVNTASRMESNGEVGRIHCSAEAADLFRKSGLYEVSERGQVLIKGKGYLTTYWLEGAKVHNHDSNAKAIRRTHSMVNSILSSSAEDFRGCMSTLPIDSTVTLTDDFSDEEGSEGEQEMFAIHPLTRFGHASGKSGDKSDKDATVTMMIVAESDVQRKILWHKLSHANKHWDVHYALSGEDGLVKLKASNFMFDFAILCESVSYSGDSVYNGKGVSRVNSNNSDDNRDSVYSDKSTKHSSAQTLRPQDLAPMMKDSFHNHRCMVIVVGDELAYTAAPLSAFGIDKLWQAPVFFSPSDLRTEIDRMYTRNLRQQIQLG